MATVIAPYEATSSEQLSLQKGQLIMIRKKTDSGWWEGELQVCIIKIEAFTENLLKENIFRAKVDAVKSVGSQRHT